MGDDDLRHRRRPEPTPVPRALPRPRVDVAAAARGASRRWSPWLDAPAGDPGRVHAEGLAARVAVEEAREQVAALLGARGREVVFTSGATEAIAAAVLGRRRAGRPPGASPPSSTRRCGARPSATARSPWSASTASAGSTPTTLLAAVRPDTAARPRAVGQPRGRHRASRSPRSSPRCRERGVLVHVDAAPGRRPRRRSTSTTSAPTSSRSAPTSSAARPASAPCSCAGACGSRPLLVGGDQERARRAGLRERAGHRRLRRRRARWPPTVGWPRRPPQPRACTDRVLAGVADARRRRTCYGDPVDRRCPTSSASASTDVEPQAVLLGLDRAGVAAHSGSACSSESLEPSPVLEAMGVDAHRSLRVSVGWSTHRRRRRRPARRAPRRARATCGPCVGNLRAAAWPSTWSVTPSPSAAPAGTAPTRRGRSRPRASARPRPCCRLLRAAPTSAGSAPSPAVRCRDTVGAAGRDARRRGARRRRRWPRAPAAARPSTWCAKLAAKKGDSVLCTHGDLIPEVLRRLARDGRHARERPAVRQGLDLGARRPTATADRQRRATTRRPSSRGQRLSRRSSWSSTRRPAVAVSARFDRTNSASGSRSAGRSTPSSWAQLRGRLVVAPGALEEDGQVDAGLDVARGRARGPGAGTPRRRRAARRCRSGGPG